MLVEPLESRSLMTGNVAVRMSSDALRMTGDAAANTLVVVQSRETGELVITGLNGTTIDGKATRTYPARANYSLALGDGDDSLTLDRFSGGSNLSVRLGAGSDAVYVKRASLSAADLYGDTGNDTLDITTCSFAKRLRIFAGEQDDTTALRAVRARRGLEVTDTAGNSIVAMKQVSASGESFISGSTRHDALTITDSDFTAFSAKLKAGNDVAFVRGTTFLETSPIDGGDGSNDINREVLEAWDFNEGLQGWNPTIVSNGRAFPNQSFEETATQQGYEFTPNTSLGALNLPAKALSVRDQTHNDNESEFFYLVKSLTGKDGVEVGRRYAVSADLRVIASGIESTFAFGVLPFKPAGIQSGSGAFLWNVEPFGTSPDLDTFATDPGTIGLPKNIHKNDLPEGFTLYRISEPGRIVEVGDSASALWPTFAVTSDLPAGATPMAVYVVSVSIKLTPL